MNKRNVQRRLSNALSLACTAFALSIGLANAVIASSFVAHWTIGANAYSHALDAWLVLPVFTYMMG